MGRIYFGNLGVIDQRSNVIETAEVIRQRLQPALEYFSPQRLLLTSECGFGPRSARYYQKIEVLTETCRQIRKHTSMPSAG